MTVIVLFMIMILALSCAVGGLVMIGMEGRGRERAPKLARELTRAARHLNGDGQPPRKLVRLLHLSPSR